MEINRLASEINQVFVDVFGVSALSEGKDDLSRQVMEFSRASTLSDMRTKIGCVITSALQRSYELDVDPSEVVRQTLGSIRERSSQYKSLGRRVRVAILGGAMNPITNGHIKNAQHVLDNADVDFVWIMPCFAHLYGKEMASAKDRLEMCRLAAKADKRIEVSDYEITRQLSGETYYMIKRLMQEPFANQYEFSFIIGQDNANTFDRWSNYKHLEQAIRFIVCPRPGTEFDPDKAWYMKPPHMYLKSSDSLMEISSTQVRQAIRLGDSIGYMSPETLNGIVDAEVFRYINKHHLYEGE